MKKVLLFILCLLLVSLTACKQKESISAEMLILKSENSYYYYNFNSPPKLISDQHEITNFRLGADKKTLFFDIDNSLYYVDTSASKVKVNVIGECDYDYYTNEKSYTLSENGRYLTYSLYNALTQYDFKKNTKRIIASHVINFATTVDGQKFAYLKADGGLYFKNSLKAQPELLEENVNRYMVSEDLNAFLIFCKNDSFNTSYSLVYFEKGGVKTKVCDNIYNIYINGDEFCLNNFLFTDGNHVLKAFSNGKVKEIGRECSVLCYYQSKCYYKDYNKNQLYYFDGNNKHFVDDDITSLELYQSFMNDDVSSIVYKTSNGIFLTKSKKVYEFDETVDKDSIIYTANGKYIYYIARESVDNSKVIKRKVGQGSTILAEGDNYNSLSLFDTDYFYHSLKGLYKNKELVDEELKVNDYRVIMKYKKDYIYVRSTAIYILIKNNSPQNLADTTEFKIAGNKLVVFPKKQDHKYDAYYYNGKELIEIAKDIDAYYTVYKQKNYKYDYIKYVNNF